jgi:hypothetical protein
MRSTLVCHGLSISQADGAAHHTTSIRYRSSRLQAAGASIPSALSVGSSPPERPGVDPNSFDPASGHALRSSCSTSQSRTQERRAFRSVASVSPYFSLLDWSSMSSQTKVSSSVPVRQSEFAVAQKARASALERADSERAQKRLDSDARLDVNASKWRYVCPGT